MSHYGYAPVLSGSSYYFRPSGGPSDPMVRWYQDILAYWGSRGLPIGGLLRDGQLGTLTSTAVSAYQRQSTANGRPLAVNGTLDEPTKAALARSAPQAMAAGFIASAVPPGGTAAVVAQGGKVTSIITKDATGAVTGVVSVPDKVAGAISPAVADQLSKMPADAAQSFVNDLSNKASQAESTGQAVQNAVPIVQSNGTVTAGVTTTPVGWWAQRTDGEKAGVVIGGVAVVGLITWLIVRK